VPSETIAWRQAIGRAGLGGPLLFDHGHHLLAVACWLFGDVRDGFARIEMTTLPNGAVVDAPASLTWRHWDPPIHGIWDITAAPRMRIRTDYYPGHEQFEIQGETGIITVTRCSDRLLDEPALTLYADGEVRAFHNLETDWGVSFRLSTEHFIRFLRGQEPRAVLTGMEGRRVLAFAHALMQSSREERPLALPPRGFLKVAVLPVRRSQGNSVDPDRRRAFHHGTPLGDHGAPATPVPFHLATAIRLLSQNRLTTRCCKTSTGYRTSSAVVCARAG